MNFLTQERALIFRITHCENLPWIFANGIRCRSSKTVDPKFIEIGRSEIISRRTSRAIDKGPGGVLADYVPFYFTPRTPMLMNIKTGWQGLPKRPMNDIAILVASLKELPSGARFVFSDRNATLQTADFHEGLEELDELPWELWRASDFRKDDSRPDKIERYQAEALIHRSLPAKALKAIVCYTETRKVQVAKMIMNAGLSVPVHCRSGWYC